jgi:hypothetical protein
MVATMGSAILARVDRTAAALALSDLFTAYLTSGRAPQPSAELARALARAGYWLEAAVVSGAAGATVHWPGSIWHGRRLWTGTRLPEAARAGDVWLDTCQLSPMLLVPRGAARDEDEDQDVYAWIDTRPVHRWQYATFLALAAFAPRPVQLDPPLRLLDPSRLLRGSPMEAVTELTPDEARLCANWFGKAVCGLFAWQLANALLPQPEMSALWEMPAREWAGGYQDGLQLAVSATTIDRDPDEESEADVLPPEEDRMLFGEWAHSPATTFRTCAYLQLGLLTEPGEDGAWHFPLRLTGRAPR